MPPRSAKESASDPPSSPPPTRVQTRSAARQLVAKTAVRKPKAVPASKGKTTIKPKTKKKPAQLDDDTDAPLPNPPNAKQKATKAPQLDDADAPLPNPLNAKPTATKAQLSKAKTRQPKAENVGADVVPPPPSFRPSPPRTPLPTLDLGQVIEQRNQRLAAAATPDDDLSDAGTTTMEDAPPRSNYNFEDYEETGYDDELMDEIDEASRQPSPAPRRHSTDGRRSDDDGTRTPRHRRPQSADARGPSSSPPSSPPRQRSPSRSASPPARGRSLTSLRFSRSRSHSSGRRAGPPPRPRPHSSAPPPTPPPPDASSRTLRHRQSAVPRPPSASSSDISTDDEYGKQQVLEAKERERQAKYDRRPARTLESEDEEETLEFERQASVRALDEDTDTQKSKTKKSSKSGKGKGKGKGKEVAAVAQAQADGGDERDATETAAAGRKSGRGKAKGKGKAKHVEEEEEEEEEEGGHYSRGPVPQAIRDRLATLQDDFLAQVAELAAECNKPPAILHRILGVTNPLARAVIAWNVYQVRHSVEEPFKDSGLTPEEYNKASRAAFLAACGDVDPSDTEAVFRKLPDLRKWHHKMMETAILQLADDGKLKSKVQIALKPLIDQARHMHTNFGVHVWGLCIDPQGEASFAFGATDEFKIIREQQKLPLNAMIKDWETNFRYLLLHQRDPSAAHGAILPGAITANDGENRRDCFRRSLATILHAQIPRMLVMKGQPAPHKMPWNINFLNAAFTHKFRLINYPQTLAVAGLIIGSTFEMRKITVKMFDEFMPALERANVVTETEEEEDEAEENDEKIMKIVSWNAHELLQPLEEQFYLPLVLDVDGNALFKAHHSDAYIAAQKDTGAKKATDGKRLKKRARSPSRAGSNTRSASPHNERDNRRPKIGRPTKKSRRSPSPDRRDRASPPPPSQSRAPVPRPGPSDASTSRGRPSRRSPSPDRRGRASPPPTSQYTQSRAPVPRPGPSDASTSRGRPSRRSPSPDRRGRASPPPPRYTQSRAPVPRPGPSDASTSRASQQSRLPPAVPRSTRPAASNAGSSQQRITPAPPAPDTYTAHLDMSTARFAFPESEIFRVGEWQRVANPNRADRATRVYSYGQGRWVSLPDNISPIPVPGDRDLYWSEVELHGLDGY
ncbi:hypothetical protein C8R44DRAFT_887206 [Mycena epipterygia]|nr:hypothetical protein C8R44DRAFT_887206 [Mycena epipterygia]